jgi:hypothetical protein
MEVNGNPMLKCPAQECNSKFCVTWLFIDLDVWKSGGSPPDFHTLQHIYKFSTPAHTNAT